MSKFTARRAFTLIEVMVAVAIIAILASVTVPIMTSSEDAWRVRSAAGRLDSLANGIARFRTSVGRYPSQLYHLTTEITNTDQHSCGSNFSPGNVNSWRSTGPYIKRPLTTAGAFTRIGIADNDLIRTASPVTLQINVPNVRVQDADDLEDLKEPGDNDINSGMIRRTAPDANGLVTMQYVIEGISGC